MGEPIRKFDFYLISSIETGLSIWEDRAQQSSQRVTQNGRDTCDSTAEGSFIWDELLSLEEVSCVLQQLPSGVGNTPQLKTIRTRLEKLCRLVQSKNVAFLLENNPNLAADIGADGVHLSLPLSRDYEFVDRSRQAIGKTAILGLAVDGTRHHAMISGEAGADYLGFEKDESKQNDNPFELLEWWSDLFEIPAVAWNLKNCQDVKFALLAGAEFLAVPAEMASLLKPRDNIQNSYNEEY